jgi:hypothetical protein
MLRIGLQKAYLNLKNILNFQKNFLEHPLIEEKIDLLNTIARLNHIYEDYEFSIINYNKPVQILMSNISNDQYKMCVANNLNNIGSIFDIPGKFD